MDLLVRNVAIKYYGLEAIIQIVKLVLNESIDKDLLRIRKMVYVQGKVIVHMLIDQLAK